MHLVYLLIFFYQGAGFTVIPIPTRDDACYYFRTSESTPKAVYSFDTVSNKARDISTYCATLDFSRYEPKAKSGEGK